MIYLSSYRMGHNADVLTARQGQARAGIVFNALDVFGETRLRSWDREAQDLARLGYTSEEVDLRDYVHDHQGLVRHLDALDLIWAVGGNSFVLARAMTGSGFAAALKLAMQRGLTYSGYSAGACVAGPDLRGIEFFDGPHDLPEGYDADIPPTTLGLVPFRIVPHWRSDHPETAKAERAVEYLTHQSLPHRAISDGDAIIIEDHGCEARP